MNDTVTIGGDLTVNRLGYGAMQLTGKQVWGEYPDRDAGIDLLRRIVDAGVNFIDTADVYGPHTNEILIHDALHPYPEGLVIATKGGFVRGGFELSTLDAVGNKNYLRQSARLSARRLGVDQLDLYYLHSGRATDVPFEEQVSTLAELRDEGLIKHIGLSNVTLDQFLQAQQIVEIAAVTAHYNVTVRTGQDLFDAAEQAGAVVSPWHPVSLIDGDKSEQAAAVLEPIAKQYGVSLRQVALAWQLQRSPAVLPIPGTTSFDHFQENLAAAAVTLTPEQIAAITGIAG
ncbi:hypothetical protein EV642_12167 [Kribbella sp. VKM Ac-2500]|uniref:aldo/keto reductase n=1 Tax=Kribbella sp. VKM Ac-2500 TaxID=2512214 RepID=UPI00104DE493|nr:aldo/keto reductase [Kribbella sp. VKM Ac-2500]TCN34430.1 hypothetical protein EV642_12167 [Kribbella sp. VKM Ac-2500]